MVLPLMVQFKWIPTCEVLQSLKNVWDDHRFSWLRKPRWICLSNSIGFFWLQLPPNWFRKTHEKLVYLVENSIYLHDIFILNLVHHCFWAHAKIGNGRQRIQWEVSTQHVQTPQVPPALERLIPYPQH